MDISDVRRFVGLLDDEQDAILTGCLQAAIGWYTRAGVAHRDGDALYDFWVMSLATWFYDNRGATGQDAAIPPSIVTSVHQLRASNPTEERSP